MKLTGVIPFRNSAAIRAVVISTIKNRLFCRLRYRSEVYQPCAWLLKSACGCDFAVNQLSQSAPYVCDKFRIFKVSKSKLGQYRTKILRCCLKIRFDLQEYKSNYPCKYIITNYNGTCQ